MNNTFGGWGVAGVDDTTAGAGGQDWSWLAPLTAGLTGNLVDPVREANVLRAQLRDAIARGLPISQVEKIRARLEAAERRASIADDRVRSTRVWTQIGQAAAIAGVAVLVLGGAAITVRMLRR
jgi:hypothetical protein